jgi:hypothetical protein
MPFTLAHPGFVYHLKKWKPNLFSMEGLIVGSFVPDFDIIFRFTENRFHLFTFTPLNVLFVIFPLAFLSWLFYKLFLQKTLCFIFDVKYEKPKLFETKNIISVAFSLLLSIIIHLILDFFAHPDAYSCSLYVCNIMDNDTLFNPLFYFFLYFPLVFFSLYGFILLFFQLKKTNYFDKKIILNWFEGEKISFWLGFISLALLVFLIKIKLNGLEAGFGIDSLLLFSLSGFFYGGIMSIILYGLIIKRQPNFGFK